MSPTKAVARASEGSGRAGSGERPGLGLTPAAKRPQFYLRWRILLRIRRFFRPTLRRPLLFLIG